MTITSPRPDTGTTNRPNPRRHRAPAPADRGSGLRRTLLALLATALGVIPLKGLFSDYGWLPDVWLTMIIVLGPAAVMRRRRAPGALDIWPGIILLVPWLTARFVGAHAFAGFLPTRATWHDLSLLLSDLHDTTRNDVAPIHTTVAVRLVVCALLGLVAALVDLVAVVGHRGALAGVPLLVIYTVAGAVPRHPVSWLWFVFAAVGYLVLLGIDAGDDLHTWGRRIRPTRSGHGGNAMSVTTPRIAVAAVVVAIVLPLLVPGQSRNLIANAFHNSGGGASSGVGGFGGGSTGAIAPFAALQGQLNRPTPVQLMKVHLLGKSSTQPFYLRVNVLDQFTGDGWRVGDHGSSESIASTSYQTEPAGGEANSVKLRARISLSGQFKSNAPVFTVPTALEGLSNGTEWNPQDQILLGDEVSGTTNYTETFVQPEPTKEQLSSAADENDARLQSLVALPADLPSQVRDVVARVTRNASGPYAKALAINSYFTDPKNGFIYDLQTKQGDSGNALVDFLQNKQGYCQQYAAAEAVMLRQVGVPSRVVLGYMHPTADDNGNFTVTTSEAHSWVEAYFSGIGWIPFDPTPAAGLVGGAKTDLPWAPHSYAGQGGSTAKPPVSQPKSVPTQQRPSAAPASTGPESRAAAASHPTSLTPLWWSLLGLGLILTFLVPSAVRVRRRRGRYLSARQHGDTDALWAELSDTALDLGHTWSPARSPRQVASWLARDAPESEAQLHALAEAVERRWYSPTGHWSADGATLAAGLRSITGELRSRCARSTRARAVIWPASLGWGPPFRHPAAPGHVGLDGENQLTRIS